MEGAVVGGGPVGATVGSGADVGLGSGASVGLVVGAAVGAVDVGGALVAGAPPDPPLDDPDELLPPKPESERPGNSCTGVPSR